LCQPNVKQQGRRCKVVQAAYAATVTVLGVADECEHDAARQAVPDVNGKANGKTIDAAWDFVKYANIYIYPCVLFIE
jgi:hypothetical protein